MLHHLFVVKGPISGSAAATVKIVPRTELRPCIYEPSELCASGAAASRARQPGVDSTVPAPSVSLRGLARTLRTTSERGPDGHPCAAIDQYCPATRPECASRNQSRQGPRFCTAACGCLRPAENASWLVMHLSRA